MADGTFPPVGFSPTIIVTMGASTKPSRTVKATCVVCQTANRKCEKYRSYEGFCTRKVSGPTSTGNSANRILQCQACFESFHYRCARVNELELAHISAWYCPLCLVGDEECEGFEIKIVPLPAEHADPSFVGGKAWIAALMESAKALPTLPEEYGVRCADGFALEEAMAEDSHFTKAYHCASLEGTGLTYPGKGYGPIEVVKDFDDGETTATTDVYGETSGDMTMTRVAELYYQAEEERTWLYNTLSLEFSGSSAMKRNFQLPNIVRQLSWTTKLSNAAAIRRDKDDIPKMPMYDVPKAEHYCLISMGGSWTDFHRDFGGSSVYYSVQTGEKLFLLVPPTPENLEIYDEALTLKIASRAEPVPKRISIYEFLLERGVVMYKLTIREGEMAMIPAGWIHGVLTPRDSFVFGGNFLHDHAIRAQLDIHAREHAIGIPDGLRYPNFEMANWQIALERRNEMRDRTSYGRQSSERDVADVRALLSALTEWQEMDKGTRPVDPTRVRDKVTKAVLTKREKLLASMTEELAKHDKLWPETPETAPDGNGSC